MPHNKLYIWVEGNDDQRLFDAVVRPMFERKYDLVKVVKYAAEKKQYVTKYIKSITGMNADYIWVGDIDSEPCVSAKKAKIRKRHANVRAARIIIVIKEIESWYLAGIDSENLRDIGVSFRGCTDTITKEAFRTMRPKKYEYVTHFMIELLNRFSLETAKRKNASFRYFAEKYGL